MQVTLKGDEKAIKELLSTQRVFFKRKGIEVVKAAKKTATKAKAAPKKAE